MPLDVFDDYHSQWRPETIALADGSDVTDWLDDNNTNNRDFNQSSASLKPRYDTNVAMFGGTPGVHFGHGATHHYMDADHTWGITEGDLFILVGWDLEGFNVNTYTGCCYWGDSTSADNHPWTDGNYNVGILRDQRNVFGAARQELSRRRPHILRVTSNGTIHRLQIWTDGALLMSSELSASHGSFSVPDLFRIGVGRAAGDRRLQGWLGQIVLYDYEQSQARAERIFRAMQPPIADAAIWSTYDYNDVSITRDNDTQISGGAGSHPCARLTKPIYLGQKKQWEIKLTVANGNPGIGVADTGKWVTDTFFGSSSGEGMSVGYLCDNGVIQANLTSHTTYSGKTVLDAIDDVITFTVDSTLAAPELKIYANDNLEETIVLPVEMFPLYLGSSMNNAAGVKYVGSSLTYSKAGFADQDSPIPFTAHEGTKIIHDAFSYLTGTGDDVHNQTPDQVDNGNNWQDADTAFSGTVDGDEFNATQNNRVAFIDTDTNYFYARVRMSGQSNLTAACRVCLGVTNENNFLNLEGYSFGTRGTTAAQLQDARLVRVEVGPDTNLLDANSNDGGEVGFDGEIHFLFDGRGVNPIIEGCLTRLFSYAYLKYEDTDAAKNFGEWFGLLTARGMEVGIYDLNPPSGAVNITPDSSIMALSSEESVLVAESPIAPDNSFMTLTGEQAALTTEDNVVPDAGSTVLTSEAASLVAESPIAPDDSVMTLTGEQATLSFELLLVPDASSMALSSEQANIIVEVILVPADASMTLSSEEPTLTALSVISPDASTMALLSEVATIVVTLADITPDASFMELTSENVVLQAGEAYYLVPRNRVVLVSGNSDTAIIIH